MYSEKIFTGKLNEIDIYNILRDTENGFEDIISKRSSFFKENPIDMDELNTNDLIKIIIENPKILRRPIIVDTNKLQVGYNDDDIRIFLPNEYGITA